MIQVEAAMAGGEAAGDDQSKELKSRADDAFRAQDFQEKRRRKIEAIEGEVYNSIDIHI